MTQDPLGLCWDLLADCEEVLQKKGHESRVEVTAARTLLGDYGILITVLPQRIQMTVVVKQVDVNLMQNYDGLRAHIANKFDTFVTTNLKKEYHA